MYYSKWILLVSILLFFACKSEPTSTATTQVKTPAVQESPVKQVAKETVNLSTAQPTEPSPPTSIKVEETKEKPITTNNTIKPAVSKKIANTDIKIKEVQESNPTKATSIKKEVSNNGIQIKEKIAEKVQESATTLPTPPTKVAQPKIVATAPIIPKEETATHTPPKEVVELKPELTHTLWDGVLRKYVSAAGKVNYKGLKADKNFESYLQLLADNPIQPSWSRNKKMAYWINAYNAFTIKLIADNYPINSITNLHGGKPWDHKWIQLGDKMYTLNDIEHKILRPQFKDARIHFAVNCAATSCPPVLNRAWTADNLNSNLDKQTKLFINNAAFNSISEKKVELSKIFEWYGEDFGDLISYLNKYTATKIKDGAKVSYKEYDWGLNE